MNKITKETIKRIKGGYHDDLMDAIEFLIDTYKEDKFDAGYKSCLEDLSVRSYRLAEHIHKEALRIGKKIKTDLVWILEVDELAKIIEDYYTNVLK